MLGFYCFNIQVSEARAQEVGLLSLKPYTYDNKTVSNIKSNPPTQSTSVCGSSMSL